MQTLTVKELLFDRKDGSYQPINIDFRVVAILESRTTIDAARWFITALVEVV